MIPEGRHKAKAVQAAAGTTASEKEFVGISLDIGGELRTYRGFLGSDKQVEYTSKALRACGWDGNDLFSLPGTVVVEVVIEHREYNGKTYDDVKYINALTPAASADRARAMAARLRGDAPPRDEPPPHTDDDIPF